MVSVNYERQQSLVGFNVPETISVIGTGGFGGWLAFFAAMSGVRRLILFGDGDVKDTDLAKLPYEPNQVGQPHSEAMAAIVRRFRPDVAVEPHGPFDPIQHAALLEGIVFNGAPGRDLEDAIVKIARERGLGYFSGVYSGLDFGVFDFTPQNLRTTDEPGAFWTGVGALSAIIALYSAFFEVVNFYGSPSRFNMSSNEVEKTLEQKHAHSVGTEENLVGAFSSGAAPSEER